MRFLTAVALALVMLWVPVDASGQDASGQEVTIEAVEMTTRQGSGLFGYSRSIKFRSRNNTSRTIVAWRGDLQIRDPFGDVIWDSSHCVPSPSLFFRITHHCEPLIFGDDSDLPPNGTAEESHNIYSVDPSLSSGGYELKDLTFLWTNLRVAY